MPSQSRRSFGWQLGAGLGTALLAPMAGVSSASGGARRIASDDPIRLSSNENPLGPSPRVSESLRRALADAAHYPFAEAEVLRSVIAEHHGVEPAGVAIGCGSTEVLRMAAMAFLDRGKTLVVAEPTFGAVIRYARIPAARPIAVPLTSDHRHDLEAMARACDARTGLVYVCNPNNPTGTIVRQGELARFIEAVPETAQIVIDEAYEDFVEAPDFGRGTDWLGRRRNVLVARTFSKIHGLAGMRLGYALGSTATIRALLEHRVSSSANIAVLAAAEAALTDAEEIRHRRRLNLQIRDFTVSGLRRRGLDVMESHASFLMVKTGAVPELRRSMRAHGILVGRDFPPLHDWLRVSIGTHAQMERFLNVLGEIRPELRLSA